MPNNHPCQWVRWVSSLPHPKRGGMLGVGAPTPWSAQMSLLLSWSYLALSRDIPYHIGDSLCLPMPLCGRGLRSLTESDLSPGIMIGRDRYHEIPIASGSTPSIGCGLWRSAYSCPLLIIVCKQRKSVIWKMVVSKHIGEILARAPGCPPPVNWVVHWGKYPDVS